MNVSKSLVSVLAVFTITALSASAFAQLRSNPTFGQRNLTNAKNTVEIMAGPLSNYGDGGITLQETITGVDLTTGEVENGVAVGLNLGAAYGVNNDLSIGAIVAPLALSPEFAYGNPTLFGKYRFLHGSFEMAGALGITIPVEGDFAMSVGVPMRNRGMLRFDVTPTVNLIFGEELITSVGAPINAFYNVAPDIFVGLVTGVMFTNEFKNIGIPLGLGAGYTLQAPEGPMLDITATFKVPGLVIADETSFVFDSGWSVGLGASYHLYL